MYPSGALEMSPSKPQAYIRQLCCLGLARETLLAELLRALHCIISSEDNFFVGVDACNRPVYVLAEKFSLEALDLYLNEPDQFFTPDYNARANQWFSTHRLLPDFRILDPQFYQRDFYHVVMRPNNHHYALQGGVYQSGRGAGVMVLCRPSNQPPFETRHQQIFERLLPYIDHGLETGQHANEHVDEYIESGQTGLVILTRDGTVISLSASAQNLLFQATYGLFPRGRIRFSHEIARPVALQQVCVRLERIFQSQDTLPPVSTHTNASGRFVFRAYWLNPPTRIPSPQGLGDYRSTEALIGILIEHQEPLQLRLCRAMQSSRLSSREQEICLAIADKLSYPMIAARLNLHASTVATYVRRIHEKLGTNSREELLKALLTGGPEQPGFRVS